MGGKGRTRHGRGGDNSMVCVRGGIREVAAGGHGNGDGFVSFSLWFRLVQSYALKMRIIMRFPKIIVGAWMLGEKLAIMSLVLATYVSRHG